MALPTPLVRAGTQGLGVHLDLQALIAGWPYEPDVLRSAREGRDTNSCGIWYWA